MDDRIRPLETRTFIKGFGEVNDMDNATIGFFIFTWIFFGWLAYFCWQMIQSILDLNDEIFGHLGLKNQTKVVEGQMSLADFSEDE